MLCVWTLPNFFTFLCMLSFLIKLSEKIRTERVLHRSLDWSTVKVNGDYNISETIISFEINESCMKPPGINCYSLKKSTVQIFYLKKRKTPIFYITVPSRPNFSFSTFSVFPISCKHPNYSVQIYNPDENLGGRRGGGRGGNKLLLYVLISNVKFPWCGFLL